MTPQRIQRKRTKGWRMPEGAVYVGRPSVFGNPFEVGETIERSHPLAGFVPIPGGWGLLTSVQIISPQIAVEAFSVYLFETPAVFLAAFDQLPGRDLACWCPPGRPCHADVLLEMVNAEVPA